MNTNTFEMYSNTNTLHFSQKYSNTNAFKNVFEYKCILPRPGSEASGPSKDQFVKIPQSRWYDIMRVYVRSDRSNP